MAAGASPILYGGNPARNFFGSQSVSRTGFQELDVVNPTTLNFKVNGGLYYKLRPDVKAVIHSHSPSVIPFGAARAKLQPIYHMSAFLGTDVPVFEIRDVAGNATDLLVRDKALSQALAKTLGHHPVALMRGHGSVTPTVTPTHPSSSRAPLTQ